ncbi:outer membrane protein assembly factor BamB family protein [Virgisporangium ochraceum]|uniref:outer membrane protein assembly factor BamB family protein n=1 Tax=Virgisporangium ochraceum TaxID=65505 RepID=UPI0019412356|nr:PQQ-binding-like beta-propeller repeat protein [Virgisporangium ochraceum]
MAEALIDLGDLGRDEPPPAGPRPSWLRRWRQPSRSRAGTAFGAVVVVVAALLIGPEALPQPARFAGPARIPGSGADEFFIAGDVVVVQSGNDRVLRAYTFDGTLRWATATPVQRAGPSSAIDGVLPVAAPMWPGQVGGLDLATGRVRWTVDGNLNGVADGLFVIGRGTVEPDPNVRMRDLIGIDPATGREVWHAMIPPPALGERLLEIYGAGNRVAARARVRADGTADLLDLRTGRWRTISAVPPAPPGPEAPAQPGTAAGFQVGLRVGDVTMVFAVGAEPAEGASYISLPGLLVAYGPDAAEPRWTRPTTTWAPALACGPWICLADGADTQVVDPQTGRDVRRVGWPHVLSGTDRRFLGHVNVGTNLQVAVSDAATGKVLHRHLGWDLVSQRYADWTPILHRDGGLDWRLATLNMETGVAYPLGEFQAAGQRSCQSVATHVACSVRSGEILVWRVVPSR